MTDQPASAAPLTAQARSLYDVYDRVLADLVVAIKLISLMPIADMIAVNLRMDTTGIRYIPGQGAVPADREDLAAQRQLFQLAESTTAEYNAIVTKLAAQVPASALIVPKSRT